MNSSQLEWGPRTAAARIAEDGCILRTVVGSQVHGVVRAGTDDRDEMGITIEPPEYSVGLQEFRHYSYRTQPEGKQSGPGDLDLIVYSLRRYCQLALKGSPTVLLPLFAPSDKTLICTEVGEQLRGQAESFIGPAANAGFLGYLNSQRQGLVSGKGSRRGQPRERERSDEHGYDTKYAMHALRIGYQGIELFNDGRITLPVPEPQNARLMDVRLGKVPPAEILDELDELIRQLEEAPVVITDPPPELGVEQWLVATYLEHWRSWSPTYFE